MKTCKDCPSPAKCKAAGKCLKKMKMQAGGLTVVLGMPVDTGAGLPANIQAMLDRGEFKKAAEALKKLQDKKVKPKAAAAKRNMGYNKGGYAKCGASNPPSKKR